jgi:hypothetical protein
MEKIIEKDSPRIPLLVLAAIFFLILIGAPKTGPD